MRRGTSFYLTAKLSKRCLKRSVSHSVVPLQAAIDRFVSEMNDYPRPFL